MTRSDLTYLNQRVERAKRALDKAIEARLPTHALRRKWIMAVAKREAALAKKGRAA